MDWLIDRRDPRSAERTLSGVHDHLQRHAAFGAGAAEAVDQVRSALAAVPPSTEGDLLRLHLDWVTELPRVTIGVIRDRSRVEEAGVPHGTPVDTATRALVEELTEEELAHLTLDIERQVQDAFDDGPPPMLRLETDPRTDGAASVALALASAAEAHPSANPEQTAALAGASIADTVAAPEPPTDAASVARLVAEAHQALGSDARVLRADERSAEVVMSRCPFGKKVEGARSLCHVSTGLAGRLAARVNGTATVVLDESIAVGDEECHLQVWFDAPDEEVRGERHRWPPVVGNPENPTPHLDLSVNLPREGGSVPVVRRLAGQALHAFGVKRDDIDDVQLAITEACANVIDHAADTDTYEVNFELAADRCAITVIDTGGGFDATAVPAEAEHSAESGRGLALMRALVDKVAFRSEPQAGAVVHMVKTLDYDPSHPLWKRAQEK